MRTALVIVRQKTDFSKFNRTLKVVKKSSYFGKKLMIKSMPNPKPPRMMSSSANDRPFLSSFRHIPPQESFVQLTNLTIQIKNGRRGERLIWSNLG